MVQPTIDVLRKHLTPRQGSVYIIAEVGMNHNGDLGCAIEHIRQAAQAGADAVKFQNWVAEDFVSDRLKMFTYKSRGREVTEAFYDLCKRNEMGENWLSILSDVCKEESVDFLSTPTSENGVDDLNKVGVRVLKNGSDYLSHIPLINYMSRNSDVLIISTGMSTQKDINYALEAVSPGCLPVLLHCTSVYPTPPEEANLNRMCGLSRQYGLPVGYSDHTEGNAAAVQAVTLGARILEKHFTLSHDLEGPDHWFSVTPDELCEYVDAVRNAEMRLGEPDLVLAPSEVAIAKDQRLSAVAVHDLVKGEVLKSDAVAYKKPGTGIHPAEISQYFDRKLIRDVAASQVLTEDFFE